MCVCQSAVHDHCNTNVDKKIAENKNYNQFHALLPWQQTQVTETNMLRAIASTTHDVETIFSDHTQRRRHICAGRGVISQLS